MSRIEPIRRFRAADIADVQQGEARLWMQTLIWDFTPSARIVGAAVDGGLLQGSVLVAGDRPCGYCYYVRDSQRAAIGSFYHQPPADQHAAALLLRTTLEEITADSSVRRVEAQLPATDHATALDEFTRAGFAVHWRLFMRRSTSDLPEAHLAPGYQLLDWTPALVDVSAQLLAETYQGQLDAVVHGQYGSVSGCRDFLVDVLRHPGCGTFAPALSLAVFDSSTRALAGFIVGSTISAGTAHVPQIAVHPKHWGRGLARFLMCEHMGRCATMGCDSVTLNVTEANARAVGLYRGLGFVEAHRFAAFLLDRTNRTS